jgi:hypothetical protein
MTTQEPAAAIGGQRSSRPASNTERSRALRERRRQGQGPQLGQCLACGRTIQQRLQAADRSELGRLLCRRCWLRSPEGRAADAARKREARRRKG